MEPAYAFEQDVLRRIEAEELLRSGDTVVVAVSGGSDSVALLRVLCGLRERHGLDVDLVVAHLDHRLRPESVRDAAFVAALAGDHGYEVRIGHAPELDGVSTNVEEAARDARATFLRAVADDVGASAIALGHTLEDQAETVLHRLARGAGIRGLAAMEMKRADGVIRPLLGTRRKDCLEYLEACGQEFVSDPSNEDRRFTRNRIRHDVLPVLSEALGVDMAERLATAADQIRVEADLADVEIARRLAAQGGETLSVDHVLGAGRASGRLVHGWLAARGLRPSRSQVAAIVGVAGASAPSGSVDLGGGSRVEREYGALRLASQEPKATPTPLEWRLGSALELPSGWRLSAEEQGRASPGTCAPSVAHAGAAAVDVRWVSAPLTVRTVRPGDRIRLPAGRRKLSDLFIDRKIPRAERSRLAVVALGADIIWVPGIAVAANVIAGKDAERWMRLRAERVDCRHSGLMVENQLFRVRFG